MRRPETKSPGAEGIREDLSAPDTGQSQAERQGAEHTEEPRAAAAAKFAPPNNNNNYNLVTSLLNLTKSPVSTTAVWRLGEDGGLFLWKLNCVV